ncbi:retrotransposon-related protein [Tanacetum coccineum]
MVNIRANTIVNLNSVENQLASMMIVITRLIESVIALENKINHGEGTSQRRENLGWLYRVNKLFEMDQEIRLILMHVFDMALNWNKQIMKRFGEIVTWDMYETQVRKRFESLFKDPMVELNNLKQTTNVQVYQDSFEASLNKVEINESYVVSLFINGLKEEIAYAIRMFKHATLIDVFFLSKLQDANMTVSKSINATLLTTPMTNVINNNDNRSGGNVMRTYSPGHKCSDQMYSLEVCASEEVFDEDEDCVLTKQGVIGVVENVGELMQQVSFNAMTGIPSYKTMRIKGYAGKQLLHF